MSCVPTERCPETLIPNRKRARGTSHPVRPGVTTERNTADTVEREYGTVATHRAARSPDERARRPVLRSRRLVPILVRRSALGMVGRSGADVRVSGRRYPTH